MSTEFFDCKVKYDRMGDDGKMKKITELYFIEGAINMSEAENMIIEAMTPFISGEFTVDCLKSVKYSEVIESNEPNQNDWYKCKVNFITFDDKTGKDKVTANYMLVQCGGINSAISNVVNALKGSTIDYEIISATKTAIVDIVKHKPSEEKNEE